MVVPLSIKAPGPEIAYFLQDSGAVALIAGASFVAAALAGFAQTASCNHLLIAMWPAGDHLPPAALNLDPLLAQATPHGEHGCHSP